MPSGKLQVGLHTGLTASEAREIQLWEVVNVMPDGGMLVACCVCGRHCRQDGVLARLGLDASGPMCKTCCDVLKEPWDITIAPASEVVVSTAAASTASAVQDGQAALGRCFTEGGTVVVDGGAVSMSVQNGAASHPAEDKGSSKCTMPGCSEEKNPAEQVCYYCRKGYSIHLDP